MILPLSELHARDNHLEEFAGRLREIYRVDCVDRLSLFC